MTTEILNTFKNTTNNLLVKVFPTLALAASAHAAVVIDPDFTGPTLESGTADTAGAVYLFDNIGVDQDSATGRTIDARLTINATNNVTIQSTLSDGRLGFGMNTSDVTGGNIEFTISFTYSDDGSEAVMTNFSAFSADIDSSADNVYSDVVGVSTALTTGVSLSGFTQLESSTTLFSGFTTVQLADYNDGNSDPEGGGISVASTDPDDYSATFSLEDSSSYSMVVGVDGTDSVDRWNRIVYLNLGSSVPEPSSAALLALGGLSLIARRKRA